MINKHLNGSEIPEIPTEAEQRKALMRCHFQLALAHIVQLRGKEADDQLEKAMRFATGQDLTHL